MDIQGTPPRAGVGGKQRWDVATIRMFAGLALLLFFVESGMLLLFLYRLPGLPNVAVILFDGLLLVLLLVPTLYVLVLRPYLQQCIEKHRLAEILQDSREHYRAIVDSFDGHLYICSRDHRIEFMNDRLVERTGYDATGELCYRALHGRDTVCPWCVNDRVFGGEVVRWEVQSPKDNRWYYMVNTPIYNSAGTVSKQAMIQDITERRLAEERIKESEERYRSIFQNSLVGIFRSTPAGKFLTINPALALMLGFDSTDELLKLSLPADLYVELEQREVMLGQFETSGACEGLELVWKKKNGGHMVVSLYGRPFYDAAEVLLYYEGMVLDITERKRAEQELKEANKHLQERQAFIESIVANIESGLVVTDADRRIALVNSYVLSMFGKSAEEIAGMALADFCPELNANIMAGVSGEEIQVSSGTQELTIGYNCTEMKRVDGSLAGRIIAFKDLTEVMKIRREMQAKQRLAAIGEVVARVAHEVRNPLFGITAAAQILAMEIHLNPGQKELMTSLLSEARRLNHLVDELLDCSKEIKLDVRIFDLLKTVSESISGNEPFIAEKRLTVVREFPHAPLMLTADSEKIQQVLLNIMKNAVDASLPGGKIVVAVAFGEGEVSIRVSDCGPGIPVEIIEKVFDVFYTTKKHGTGLGLAISRHIVEAHGGTLLASNNGAGGATFSVVLPLLPGTAVRVTP